MLSIARIIVAFQAAAYLALVGVTPTSNGVLATPFPMPLMKNYSASYPEEAGPRSQTLKSSPSRNSTHSNPVARSLFPLIKRSIESRQEYTALLAFVTDAGVYAKDLQQCSASCSADPQAQQQASTSSLSLFSGSLLGFQHTVSDKGLAYFNSNSGLEVLIRKLIDEIKYILNYTNDLVQCDPLLSALLGPTVYELKCFLEWLLDITEDATDASLNELAPTLRALLGQFGNCLLGTCLL
ncbi:hypothetical protein F5880DRAFT_1616653 [Lentinula raphanica]|nr:hypothetical protein F5880DRAFT_1616653 [Lentinula raphanica]